MPGTGKRLALSAQPASTGCVTQDKSPAIARSVPTTAEGRLDFNRKVVAKLAMPVALAQNVSCVRE